MRIIDKNHDFYDYLQDSTDTLVFDRKNSYPLTKDTIKTCLNFSDFKGETSDYRFVLLQCGGTFWLLLFTVTKNKTKYTYHIENYDIEVLASWKNYEKPNALFKIDIIWFNNSYKLYDHKSQDYDINRIKNNINDLIDAVNHNDFKIIYTINDSNKPKYSWQKRKEEIEIPLLKTSGINSVIEPLDMFCAVEEYFSIKKTASETTEAKGATNDDKITMHGFDTVTSFRGKP